MKTEHPIPQESIGEYEDSIRKQGWQPIDTAPKNATDVKLLIPTGGETIGHWACDLSGSDQPPFQGWFREPGGRERGFFVEIYPPPTHWKPL